MNCHDVDRWLDAGAPESERACTSSTFSPVASSTKPSKEPSANRRTARPLEPVVRFTMRTEATPARSRCGRSPAGFTCMPGASCFGAPMDECWTSQPRRRRI